MCLLTLVYGNLQKRPASLPLNVEAHQPIARVGSISLPRVLHLAPTPPKEKKCPPDIIHWTQPSTYVPTISQSWLCRTSGSIICVHGIYLLGMCSKQFNKPANIQALVGLKVSLFCFTS